MSVNQERRRARKVREAQRNARRRIKREAKAVQPKWDPDLPRTVAEIEHEIDNVSRAIEETGEVSPNVTFLPNGDREVRLTSGSERLLRLQLQLFRAVFAREPGKSDPVFWDRSREHKGVFRVDLDQMHYDLTVAARSAGARPEHVYAIGCTGRIITENNRHLMSDDDLAEWGAAVEEYTTQVEAGGTPPIPPSAFIRAFRIMNEVSTSISRLLPLPEQFRQLLPSVAQEVGGQDLARIAVTRAAAMIAFMDEHCQDTSRSSSVAESYLVAAARSTLIGQDFDFDDFMYVVAEVEDNT